MLPDFVRLRKYPEITASLLASRLVWPRQQQWPGLELGVLDWCELSGGTAVGWKESIEDGLKFYLYRY